MKPVKLLILCSVLAMAGCGDREEAEEAAPIDQTQGTTDGTTDTTEQPAAPAAPMDDTMDGAGDGMTAPDADQAPGAPEEGAMENAPVEPMSEGAEAAGDGAGAGADESMVAPVEPQGSPDASTNPDPAAGTGEMAAADTSGADLAQGQTVYQGKCQACHATGAAGAPKLDDKANWEPRIAQGMDVLVQHAIEGFKGNVGFMPPKGGFASLTDDEVRAAVAYMVNEVQN